MKPITYIDMFCGAGGFTTGVRKAADRRGIPTLGMAVNHWETAINTHSLNHPDVIHLCERIELIRALDLPGRFPSLFAYGLDLLIASPECTNHSNAKGGRPKNDQSRATAFRVLEWVEALHPRTVVIENVREFMSWGPLDEHGHPIKKRRGEIFEQWISMLVAMGHSVEYRVLNAANFGDPTTRKRFILIATRVCERVLWPDATHHNPKTAGGLGTDHLLPWVPARKIIDWEIVSKSIFTRKKKLVIKTLQRIEAGFASQGKGAEPYLILLRNHIAGRPLVEGLAEWFQNAENLEFIRPFLVHFNRNCYARSLDEPLPTQRTENTFGLAEPFLARYTKGVASPIDSPMPTQTTKDRFALAQPFILPHRKFDRMDVDSVDDPVRTIDATNGRLIGLTEPFISRYHGGEDFAQRNHSVDETLPVIDCSNRYAIVEPHIIPVTHGERTNRTHPIDEPLPTITCAHRGEFALAQAFMVPNFGERDGQSPRIHDVDDPLPTVTSHGAGMLAEPFVVPHEGFYGGNKPKSVNEPLSTITSRGLGHVCSPVVVVFEDGCIELDIHLRMLKPKELSAATSFPSDYRFDGNQDAQVRQIGNAVPVELAAAVTGAAIDMIRGPMALAEVA